MAISESDNTSPSSPERERAQDTPWTLKIRKDAWGKSPEIYNASGELILDDHIAPDVELAESIVAAVNAEGRLREAERLLASALPRRIDHRPVDGDVVSCHYCQSSWDSEDGKEWHHKGCNYMIAAAFLAESRR